MTIAVETLYDQLGRNYQVEHERNPGRHVAIDQALASLRPGSRVLDVGCGTGRPVSDCLASAGHHVFGIDISQTMIDLARQQVAMGEFTKVDMRDYQPSGTFDAIFASFSLFHLSHCETYSMMFKFCEWLKPGGLLIIGTSPSTGPDSGKTGRAYLDQICKQQVDIPFMGSSFVGTLHTTEGWRWLFESAGFSIEMDQISPVNADLDQYFIRGRKSVTHPLMGPYPLPDSYRGPHPLSEGAWKPFVERLTRHEFDAVLGIVQGNQKVLDVGSGHGELPIAIAEQLGEAYSVEPDAARNSTLVGKSKDKNVHVYPGCAEKLPFPSRNFDAVVAMWILHYVDDLDKSLREMARMVDPASPNARIVICQGAPDNELVNLINDVCTPLSKKSKRPDHQGFLLHTAARVFSEVGFGDISLQRVNAYCNFPEEDLEERCERAADVLGRFWHQEDPHFEQMKEALVPAMKMHFAGRPNAIGDQGAILIARPSLN